MYHANSKLQLKYRITNFNPSWNVLKRPVLEDNGWPFENYELWCYCGSTLLRVCSSNLSKTNIQKYFNHFNVSMCLKQTTLPLYNVIEMIIIPTYLWIIRKNTHIYDTLKFTLINIQTIAWIQFVWSLLLGSLWYKKWQLFTRILIGQSNVYLIIGSSANY